MKKVILFVFLIVALGTVQVFGGGKTCTTINQGVLTYSSGHYLFPEPFKTGYDVYGYNYQAHMFSGSFANVYLGGSGLPPYDGDDAAYLAANPTADSLWFWQYRNDQVMMKWNDAWLSNKDCDRDGRLDRHFGFPSYIGSGAWETNHQSGTYIDGANTCEWNYFVKIVAVPADAVKTDGVWYTVTGEEIGPDIWGEFAVIQEISNDECSGDHGVLYKSPIGPGLGKFD